ncbi:hypothetical protein GCM10009737_08280 [Nocardioides lentus]|uniref:Uncharacterized protein n=1 Tax=Nocardioides lentus TaxID=338077 RepID=A0ABP5ADE6_9ACTN
MFTAAGMAQHQADAESLMTLALLAEEPGPRGAPDLATMTQATPWTSKGTSIGKVQSIGRQPQGREVNVGGVTRTVMEGGLHLPVGAYVDEVEGLLIRPGWRFTVTAVGPADDVALLRQRYLVVEVLRKSRMTARRLDVVEVA